MRAPSISDSTRDERLAYVRQRYQCMGDCDLCGICASFHGKNVEQALEPYIEGKVEVAEALRNARR